MPALFEAGGPLMWPLLLLSVLALATILERLWFWGILLAGEKPAIARVLAAARSNLAEAHTEAQAIAHTPVGRFLLAPLALPDPEPETFTLALESAADAELMAMLKGDKLLEGTIALAPLLGLLGTVTGLISAFQATGWNPGAARGNALTSGLAEALITTAAGLGIAIVTLTFHRIFLAWHGQQVRLFQRTGNELELIYRLTWQHGAPTAQSENVHHA
ncbi:MAG: MotA/TolQ/ExbB proton channel family protein [Oscillatoriales cyanobacterium SM2_1_8]|nr:MotA/TolQ/ExbB proton channel family protein [Oscillatoriales cyanobacterium SM2_1_8]